MRKRVKQTGKKAISVNAIAGTYVVLLAMNATEEARKGLLGFAIHRNDTTEKREGWLVSFRTFEDLNPNPGPGTLVSTETAPVQDFMWGDYTTKPGHDYIYKVVPVYGKPKKLEYGKPVEVSITTENEDNGEHAIYFNRGVAGSQAYARKFGNKAPDKAGPEAFKWLSRGLEEAILGFIGQANKKGLGIRAAAYEFSHAGVLSAFRQAADKTKNVKIVYDCRKPEPQKTSNKAIKKAGLEDVMIPRKAGASFISHNKFIVLLKGGKPVEVLTGSTNFTDGGIYGQSNVVHIIRNPKVAAMYLDYWEQLAADTDPKKLRPWNGENNPNPKTPAAKGITPVFSPRPNLDVLQWYSDNMDKASVVTGFTAAFGVNDMFAEVLTKNKENVRFVMLEKTSAKDDVYSKVKNNFVSVGAVLNQDAVGDSELHRWVGEKLSGLNSFVKFLHTKYMFVDPMGKSPAVFSGSANFSKASTINNDENMLIVKGSTKVADIYLGEFMRLWNHFFFRDIANKYARLNAEIEKKGADKVKKSPHRAAYLVPNDSWTKGYYGGNFRKTKQREIFA